MQACYSIDSVIGRLETEAVTCTIDIRVEGLETEHVSH